MKKSTIKVQVKKSDSNGGEYFLRIDGRLIGVYKDLKRVQGIVSNYVYDLVEPIND